MTRTEPEAVSNGIELLPGICVACCHLIIIIWDRSKGGRGKKPFTNKNLTSINLGKKKK